MADLWAIPWENRYKETLWRLTVNGVASAGGHDIPATASCACGCPAPSTGTARERALALRDHCFWGCPVAQAVVAEMARLLPAPPSPLQIWTLHPPRGISPAVWPLVAAAALHAMERGRRKLWALTLPPRQPRASFRAAPTVAPPGASRPPMVPLVPPPRPRRPLPPPLLPHLAILPASRIAVGWFWGILQDFVFMQLIPPTWASVTAIHPFIGVEHGLLRLNLPPGLPTLPHDLLFEVDT